MRDAAVRCILPNGQMSVVKAGDPGGSVTFKADLLTWDMIASRHFVLKTACTRWARGVQP